MRLLIDSGYVAAICQPNLDPGFAKWLSAYRQRHPGLSLLVPEIVDYEVRRALLWRLYKHSNDREQYRKIESYIERLDRFPEAQVQLLPTTQTVLREAAKLWGLARSRGYSTAPAERIDIDVIVAAHALEEDAELATTDPRDYRRYGVKLAEIP